MKNPKKWVMITLKDISDSCGVGISTISRVLSGDRTRKIRKETEQLVIKTASDLGYFREKKLKIHANEKEVKIAGLFLSDHESILTPFFSEVFVGIKDQINVISEYMNINYRVLSLYDTNFEKELAEFSPDIAIILGRVKKPVLSFVQKHVPHLVYAGLNPIGSMDEVICEAKDGIADAVKYLAGKGYEKIGYIGPLNDSEIQNEHRFAGYLAGLGEAMKSYDETLVMNSYLDASNGYAAARALFDHARPDAVVCANDSVAIGVLKFIGQENISVAVTGFDNVELSSFTSPSLTTFDVPKRDLGRLAVICALDRMKTPRSINVRIELPYKMIIRDSTERRDD